MIKINRTSRPEQLTDDEGKSLTEEYFRTKNNVWNKSYIKDALLDMSNGKCIFCEIKINEESKYIEVEHFHPKSKYPEEVVVWGNLLPICKRCNGYKRDHDTKKQPIINPTINNPQQHLMMKNYRFKGKDKLGEDTVGVLVLNDFERLLSKRSQIGNEVMEIVEELHKDILRLDDLNKASTQDINKCLKKLKKLLSSCQPYSAYSATCSYALFGEECYHDIVSIIKKYDLWDEELEDLHITARDNCYIESYQLCT